MSLNRLVALTQRHEAEIREAAQEEIDAIAEHLQKANAIYTTILDSGADIDVWGNEEIKHTLRALGLTAKENKSDDTEGGSKRLTKAKKEAIKPTILKVIEQTPKGIKRGDIEAHGEIKAVCKTNGFATVPNLAAVLKELVKKKEIKADGERATTVYKPA